MMRWVTASLFGILLTTGVAAAQPTPRPTGQPDPAGCAPARARAQELLKEFNTRVSATDRADAQAAVQEAARKGQGRADGYNAFAAGAMLQARFTAAAWGALEASALAWNATHVANTGVFLIYLDRPEDAGRFLGCAREMDPRSPFVIEAQAMLAYQRKDCANATKLIEEAVRLLPGDMNVRYAAGIIHFKCGDRAKAKQYLLMAREQKPDDKTVQQALKVVDPAGQSASQPKDELRQLIEECFRFLDEMVARGELVSRMLNRVREAEMGPGWKPQDYRAHLRKHVEENKREISKREKTARDSAGRPYPPAWNLALYQCVAAHIEAVYDYQQMFNYIQKLSLMAAAMRTDPLLLAQKLTHDINTPSGHRFLPSRLVDYLLYDGRTKYIEALKPAAKLHGAAFCAVAVPAWQAYRAAVVANMRAAQGGFPAAAENYANYWLSFANQASDYARRAVAAMKPTADGSHKTLAEYVNRAYDSRIGTYTIGAVSDFLLNMRRDLVEALDAAPKAVSAAAAGRPRGPFAECEQEDPEKTSLEAELDKLVAALKDASKVEGGPTGFDCEVKVGAFEVNIKSAGGRHLEVKVSEEVGGKSYGLSGTTENRTGLDRFGVEASYGETDISAEGVTVKAEVKLWGEAEANGKIDYGAEVEGKLGAGVSMAGGTLACYFVQAKVKFNARVFVETLTK